MVSDIDGTITKYVIYHLHNRLYIAHLHILQIGWLGPCLRDDRTRLDTPRGG